VTSTLSAKTLVLRRRVGCVSLGSTFYGVVLRGPSGGAGPRGEPPCAWAHATVFGLLAPLCLHHHHQASLVPL
jgi:hypothetical protein